MIYKTVYCPQVISTSDGNYSDATKWFERKINELAKEGWLYHSMETIIVEEPVGCLLFGAQPKRTSIYMLIFYREDEPVTTTVHQTSTHQAPAPKVPAPKAPVAPSESKSTSDSKVAVEAEIRDDEKVCPKCGIVQKANRTVCWSCNQPFNN